MANSSSTLPLEQGAKDVALVPANPNTDMIQMIERMASNKDVDVEKLERLIALNDRSVDREAAAAFNAAFSKMQADIPEIDEKGAIKNRAGEVQSRYARFEDVQKVLKPILIRHGFALSFRSEWPDPKTVKVVGILTHVMGHARESEFLSAADESGSKNAIQGLGSAVSYGRRYTTIDLLNITTRGQDDDGQKAGRAKAPDGFDEWLQSLEVAAKGGVTTLNAAWACSDNVFKNFVLVKDWEAIKKVAKDADKAATHA